jgi:hypothetical protein
MTENVRHLFPIDRRSGKDRRNHKLPKVKFLFVKGAREGIRRRNDRHKFFIFDRYSANLLAAILIILLFSVLDALFTLFLTGNGSDELNPVMAYFLNLNPWAFLSVKYILTCLSVTIILIFHNFYYPKLNFYARHFFLYIVGAFTMVILWELYLVYLYQSA